ncbi:MAG: isoaspartyl peptidase/L-asparaginase [Rubripirellula sp.]
MSPNAKFFANCIPSIPFASKLFSATVLACLSGATLMPTNVIAQHEQPSVSWAIVIHGGAGGDPAKWDEAKLAARQKGLDRALTAGRDSLSAGGTALDTVETVIRILEDDAAFNAGRGAVVTQEGRAELDASIMDGKSRACGAVAGVTSVKNPITLARRVMTETKHVLLAGPGADEFARDQKLPLVDPSYFLSRRKRDHEPHFGTVGCVVLDTHGDLAAGTSTGGTPKKLPGRIGDSPIIGAGTYADNQTCAVSGTGIGEEYIRNAVAYDVAAQMRYANESLAGAVSEIMSERLAPGVGGIIAVSNRGQIVMQHNTPGMSCAAADSSGRYETHLALKDGGQPTAEKNDSEMAITSLLKQQVTDWNTGDVDRFMRPYWKSDELTFSSGGEVTRGFNATLARYKARYPNPETMGRLAFSELEFLPLGKDAMQVLGIWKLERDRDPIGGRFTLVLRRLPTGWKIVHDHTSKYPDPDKAP